MKSKQKTPLLTMPALPVDVIVEILCRLPVKSLLRFRCLSKQFHSIIDGPDFINRHLQNHHSIDRRLIVLSLRRFFPELFSVDFDSANNVLKLEHPFESWGNDYTLIGSCNGLLALSHRRRISVGLWNISTQKHQILPKFWSDFDVSFYNFSNVFDGFGYDVTTDDYKWVRVVLFDKIKFTEVTVYSLKANSWRRIEDLPPYGDYCVDGMGVLVGGALNWLVGLRDVVHEDSKCSVLSFDLKGEQFCQVSVPEIADDAYSYFDILAFRGSLCLSCFYPFQDVLDIWVMKEYGVKESWTKLFSFKEEKPLGLGDCSDGTRALAYPKHRVKVSPKALAYSKHGDKVLFYQVNGEVFWYDLEKETDESVEINEWPTFISRAAIYVDSLVSPVVNMSSEGYMEKRKWKNASKEDGE